MHKLVCRQLKAEDYEQWLSWAIGESLCVDGNNGIEQVLSAQILGSD